jgi:hypothetical protein
MIEWLHCPIEVHPQTTTECKLGSGKFGLSFIGLKHIFEAWWETYVLHLVPRFIDIWGQILPIMNISRWLRPCLGILFLGPMLPIISINGRFCLPSKIK